MTTAQERRQQERQARRRRIQAAAREVFAAKGYAKTSIESVARQASLSVGAIYLYFRSKEDLYVSLLEETMQKIDSELHTLTTSDNNLKASWDYLCNWASGDVEGTRILRLISQPGIRKQLSDQVAEATAKGLGKIRDHLSELINKGLTSGTFKNVTPSEASDLLWSLFLGVLQSADAKANLGIETDGFQVSADKAFFGLQSSWLATPNAVTAAA